MNIRNYGGGGLKTSKKRTGKAIATMIKLYYVVLLALLTL